MSIELTPPNAKTCKPWFTSKTLWVNAAVAGLVALEMSWPAVRDTLPSNFYAIVSVGLPVINAILRITSTTRISK